MYTDFGRYALSPPVEGPRGFIAYVLDLGFTPEGIRTTVDQPGAAAGIVDIGSGRSSCDAHRKRGGEIQRYRKALAPLEEPVLCSMIRSGGLALHSKDMLVRLSISPGWKIGFL